AAGALTQDMVKTMGPNPLILALANPDPEITPPEAKAVRPDAIVCTGRSDFSNQVNNVLCFPFIFRGALDVGATAINEEMKMAAVYAIADLAMAEQSDVVSSAYGDSEISFGPDYIIPKPFDPRLIIKIAPAVAKAAMDSGVATRPIEDFEAYIEKLTQFVYKTNLFMKPVFAKAKLAKKRVLLTDGEEPRVLHAVQEIASLGIAQPVLIGRPEIIDQRAKSLGLHIQVGRDYEIVNIENNEYHQECWTAYYELRKRNGITQAAAQREMRTNPTIIGATLLHLGKVDAMLCGLLGTYASHLKVIKDVIGTKAGVSTLATVNGLVLPRGNLFITDTFVNQEPTAEQLVDITVMAAEEIRRFGIEPQVALISHSNYGSSDDPSAVKMRDVLALVQKQVPDLIIDGEMHCDIALSARLRQNIMPDSPLKDAANLLVMPNMEAARISLNLLQGVETPITVGPILMGVNKPAHIVTAVASVRRIINMVAIAAVKAQ
ncbi:MAG TPA: hypothetical protein DD638_03320, partial [Pasteurellaceae bacterium]|nr:hypothetical protein [Pasteurellaceae bacterium]